MLISALQRALVKKTKKRIFCIENIFTPSSSSEVEKIE
jgi:hypothetical protein